MNSKHVHHRVSASIDDMHLGHAVAQSEQFSNTLNDKLEICKIVGTHGLKGEVKCEPWCDDAEIFKDIFVLCDSDGTEYVVKSCKIHKGQVLLVFEGHEDINLVESFKGKILLVDRDQMPPLGDGEYYLQDVLGIRVVTDTGRELGKLTDWIETGANLVYVIKGEREVLIPAIDDVIKDVDLEAGVMIISPLEGLLDD